MEENVDNTEMKFPADHENENTENPLSEDVNDSTIIETNIDTVKQAEEEPSMSETNITTIEEVKIKINE